MCFSEHVLYTKWTVPNNICCQPRAERCSMGCGKHRIFPKLFCCVPAVTLSGSSFPLPLLLFWSGSCLQQSAWTCPACYDNTTWCSAFLTSSLPQRPLELFRDKLWKPSRNILQPHPWKSCCHVSSSLVNEAKITWPYGRFDWSQKHSLKIL